MKRNYEYQINPDYYRQFQKADNEWNRTMFIIGGIAAYFIVWTVICLWH